MCGLEPSNIELVRVSLPIWVQTVPCCVLNICVQTHRPIHHVGIHTYPRERRRLQITLLISQVHSRPAAPASPTNEAVNEHERELNVTPHLAIFLQSNDMVHQKWESNPSRRRDERTLDLITDMVSIQRCRSRTLLSQTTPTIDMMSLFCFNSDNVFPIKA